MNHFPKKRSVHFPKKKQKGCAHPKKTTNQSSGTKHLGKFPKHLISVPSSAFHITYATRPPHRHLPCRPPAPSPHWWHVDASVRSYAAIPPWPEAPAGLGPPQGGEKAPPKKGTGNMFALPNREHKLNTKWKKNKKTLWVIEFYHHFFPPNAK